MGKIILLKYKILIAFKTVIGLSFFVFLATITPFIVYHIAIYDTIKVVSSTDLILVGIATLVISVIIFLIKLFYVKKDSVLYLIQDKLNKTQIKMSQKNINFEKKIEKLESDLINL